LSQPGTKRSLHNDLENQYRASQEYLKSSGDKKREDSDEEDDDNDRKRNEESISETQTLFYHAADARYLRGAEDVKCSIEGRSLSVSGFFNDVSTVSHGFAVSVIRHAPAMITNYISSKHEELYVESKMEPNVEPKVEQTEYSVDMKSPVRRRVMQGFFSSRPVPLSPMKSPRKQAALALVQLYNG